MFCNVHIVPVRIYVVVQPLKNDQFVIPKSRYDSVDSYLSPCGEPYNDIELIYDKEIYDQLQSAGWQYSDLLPRDITFAA